MFVLLHMINIICELYMVTFDFGVIGEKGQGHRDDQLWNENGF